MCYISIHMKNYHICTFFPMFEGDMFPNSEYLQFWINQLLRGKWKCNYLSLSKYFFFWEKSFSYIWWWPALEICRLRWRKDEWKKSIFFCSPLTWKGKKRKLTFSRFLCWASVSLKFFPHRKYISIHLFVEGEK